MNQRGQQALLRLRRELALSGAPGIEIVEVRTALDLRGSRRRAAGGGVFEPFERTVFEVAAGQRSQRGHVDGDVNARHEFDVDPVGDDTLTGVVVDQAAQLRKTPAQRAARVVGNFRKLAQVLAAEGAAIQREIGEQRPASFSTGAAPRPPRLE